MFPKICWKRGESSRMSELKYFPADYDIILIPSAIILPCADDTGCRDGNSLSRNISTALPTAGNVGVVHTAGARELHLQLARRGREHPRQRGERRVARAAELGRRQLAELRQVLLRAGHGGEIRDALLSTARADGTL